MQEAEQQQPYKPNTGDVVKYRGVEGIVAWVSPEPYNGYDGPTYEVGLAMKDNPKFADMAKYINDVKFQGSRVDWSDFQNRFKLGSRPSTQLTPLNKNVEVQPSVLNSLLDQNQQGGQNQQGQGGGQSLQGGQNYRLTQKDGSFLFTPITG